MAKIEPTPSIRKDVNYKVRYIGETYSDAINGKIYDVIYEWYDKPTGKFMYISMIDETKEDYIYFPGEYEKIE